MITSIIFILSWPQNLDLLCFLHLTMHPWPDFSSLVFTWISSLPILPTSTHVPPRTNSHLSRHGILEGNLHTQTQPPPLKIGGKASPWLSEIAFCSSLVISRGYLRYNERLIVCFSYLFPPLSFYSPPLYISRDIFLPTHRGMPKSNKNLTRSPKHHQNIHML